MNYYFGDNREYGAEDIKKALGTFVAEGGIALDLSDAVEYDVSELNKIVGSAICEGVVPETNAALKLVKTDDGYSVSAGKGIFSDGGVVEVEEDTAVEVSPGQYFYIAYSELLDDVYFLASSTESEESGDKLLIPLAYVNADGSVEDKREFARGKIPALASATWTTLREVEFSVDTSSISGTGGYVEVTHEIDGEINFMLYELPHSIISRMYIKNGKADYHWVSDVSNSSTDGTDAMVLGNADNGYYKATYIDGGIDYITLRYYIPKKNSRNLFKYTALIGVRGE